MKGAGLAHGERYADDAARAHDESCADDGGHHADDAAQVGNERYAAASTTTTMRDARAGRNEPCAGDASDRRPGRYADDADLNADDAAHTQGERHAEDSATTPLPCTHAPPTDRPPRRQIHPPEEAQGGPFASGRATPATRRAPPSSDDMHPTAPTGLQAARRQPEW